jgi:hypothetical protein
MARLIRLMRCHTPHWQGNDMMKVGTVLPEGHRKVIPIYFEPFEPDVDVAGFVDDGLPPPPQAQPPAEARKRPGRPKLPRDADGNIVRDADS